MGRGGAQVDGEGIKNNFKRRPRRTARTPNLRAFSITRSADVPVGFSVNTHRRSKFLSAFPRGRGE